MSSSASNQQVPARSGLRVDKNPWANWAVQYYVAGRFAASAAFSPIHGNLLHHAVEMFLKTALIDIVDAKEMKHSYGHDLIKLWERFKEKTADPAMDRFDETIRALHKFEKIRYPEFTSSVMFGVLWWPSEPSRSRTPSRKTSRSPGRTSRSRRTIAWMNAAERFFVLMPNVDTLVREIMVRESIDVGSCLDELNACARSALKYRNPHNAWWRRPRMRTRRGRGPKTK